MPGIKSLAAQQYYAHPQNAFWKILGDIFDMPVATYEQRVKVITKNNLALWDVLEYCERKGSLDANIDAGSCRVNDFAAFFKRHPKITRVFFNGATGEKEFRKRVPPELQGKLHIARLPSTSPAHAGMRYVDKVRAWRVLKH